METKIKILFLASNPDDVTRQNLDEEIRSITMKIRMSEYRDVLDLISSWAVRPDDLLQELNTHKPTIVHFSGHGSNSGELVLMGDLRQAKTVSPTALKALFTTLKDNIRLVVLNACYSKTQATAIAEVIDCVVGMNTSIGDQAAIAFAASFYRAIGFGRSVKEAFEQGKVSLMLEGITEEFIPELLCRKETNPSGEYIVIDPKVPELSSETNRQGKPSSSSKTESHVTSAIFISRIINPPSQFVEHYGRSIEYRDGVPVERPVPGHVTTVWLAAEGSKTFIIDSIHIKYRHGNLLSGPSGAVLPDADYHYTFNYGSDDLHALNPALRLNPIDQREVSFTLGLAPTGYFPSGGGALRLKLYYHTPDGFQGLLLLEDPPKSGIFLSKLLGKNIKVSEGFSDDPMVVSPKGIQLALGEYTDPEDTLEYIQLYLSVLLLHHAPSISHLAHREQLNKAILEQRKVKMIIDELRKGNETAFDICSALMIPECEEGIIEASSTDNLLEYGLKALSIRHVIEPSDVLASFIMSNRERIKGSSYGAIRNALNVLAYIPLGEWYSNLYWDAQKGSTSEGFERFCLLQDKLDHKQYEQVRQLCWSILETWPNQGAIKFLLKDYTSPNDLETKLLELPTPKNRNKEEELDSRKRYLWEIVNSNKD